MRQKKQKPTTAECTALSCQRLRNTDPSNRALSITVPSSEITNDMMGHTWCNYCYKCRELMNYGKEHHWPAVRAQGKNGTYALLHDADEWYISIACGNQDSIDAFYHKLIGDEQPHQENKNTNTDIEVSRAKKREKLLMEF